MSTAVALPRKAPVSDNQKFADWPFQFEVVPLKYLVIDEYQRPLTSFVDKIEKGFNPALISTLCLSKRSATKYAVIDGQTRAEGMRRRGLKDAPAVVFYDLTREQEAELFALFQTERRGMTSASRFKSQVIAKIGEAVEINEIVEGLGFRIDHNATGPDAKVAIRAVGAVEFVYRGAKTGAKAKKTKDAELLAKTLETIKTAWPSLPDTAKSAGMLRGLGFFLANDGKDADLEKLSLRLKRVQPSELAKRAESLREGHAMSGNSPAYMAEAIAAQYKRTR